jgi:hypothetical protein
VTIRGENFIPPVRVFFDTKEAVVVSATDTEIVVLTPSIDMGASTPTKEVTITVVNQAGTSNEVSVTATQLFTFSIPILTPAVYGVSPSSGPNEGNTQITIAGEQFQSPVKVFFAAGGSETEVELKHVTFNQLTAVTPPAVGLGGHLLNQSVTMRVVNVASNKSVTVSNAFRYGPEMLITSATPLQGSTQGGTQVTIFGYGFDDPVDVVIGGIVAQPTEVSGTRIVAITGTPLVTGCANVSGPISVRNRETGETAVAENQVFTFIAPRPTFVSLSPNPVVEGGNETIVIEDAGAGLYRFQIGGITVVPTATSVSGDLTTFTVVAPFGLNFQEIRCGTNNLGRQFAPFVADVEFTNLTTGCTVRLDDALVVNPTDLTCRFANASPSTNAITINDSVAGGGGTSATFTMNNTGQHDLTASPSIGPTCATGAFTVAPTGTSTIPPGSGQIYTVTFTATALGTCNASITWTTNDPDPSNPPTTIAVTGNGTP